MFSGALVRPEEAPIGSPIIRGGIAVKKFFVGWLVVDLKMAMHGGDHLSAAGSVAFGLAAQAASRLRLRAGHRRGSVCGT